MLRTAKILVSLWLCYHLFIILLFPNTQSLLSRKLDSYLLPYANSLNMNTPWQFFSPFPGPRMYIEYELSHSQYTADGTSIEGKKYYWPPLDRHDPDWDNWRRHLYSSRFVAMDPSRMKNVFVPWACRQDPQAEMISLEVILAPVPNVEKADIYSSISDMEKPMVNFKERYPCPGKNNEKN